MKELRKLLISLIGGILLLLGVLMILLPGPAIIFIPLALYILNSQYLEKSKVYIKKFQRILSKSAKWLDDKIKQWS